MADVAPSLNEVLKKYDAHIDTSRRKCSKITDEFLKEAYRIVYLDVFKLSCIIMTRWL